MSQKPEEEAEFFFQRGLRHDEVDEYEAAITSYTQAVAIKSNYHKA